MLRNPQIIGPELRHKDGGQARHKDGASPP
jgi:hypothetical protein